MKIESETGVKSDTPFRLRLPIKKTNSGARSDFQCYIEQSLDQYFLAVSGDRDVLQFIRNA